MTHFLECEPLRYHVADTGVWDFAADSVGIEGSTCQKLGSENYVKLENLGSQGSRRCSLRV